MSAMLFERSAQISDADADYNITNVVTTDKLCEAYRCLCLDIFAISVVCCDLPSLSRWGYFFVVCLRGFLVRYFLSEHFFVVDFRVFSLLCATVVGANTEINVGTALIFYFFQPRVVFFLLVRTCRNVCKQAGTPTPKK